MEGWACHMGTDLREALMTPIGIDITAVARVKQLMERCPRALARLFTEREIREAGNTRQRYTRLAGRFAAKEAIIKATGGLQGSRYRDIEIGRSPGNPPQVLITGPLGQWLLQQGYHVNLSLSHEEAFAVAMVVLEVI